MGAFSFTDQELADKAVAAAHAAWTEGRRVFAYRLRSGIGSKNDADTLLNLALNGVVDVGWQLHSVSPYINTIGPNAEIVLLTFQRP